MDSEELIYEGRSIRLTARNLRTIAPDGTETPATSGVTGSIGLYTSAGVLVIGSTSLLNDGDDWYVEVVAPAAGDYYHQASLTVGGKVYRSREKVVVYDWP